MMHKRLERRDASDCGLTVLELLPISIMFLRMSEMGEVFVFCPVVSSPYES